MIDKSNGKKKHAIHFLSSLNKVQNNKILKIRNLFSEVSTISGESTYPCKKKNEPIPWFESSKLSPTSFFKTSESQVLRTSEQEPAAYQLELPDASEMYSTIKLCKIINSLRSDDFSHHFSSLVGLSNLSLKELLTLGKIKENNCCKLQTKHSRIVIKQLLEIGEGITVQGYAKVKYIEVYIFDIPSRSKIQVIFRCINDNQQQTKQRTWKHNIMPNKKTQQQQHYYHSDMVHKSFQQIYLELEKSLHIMVDKLEESNPFAEVVFSGFKFCGGLASLASVRYASRCPTVRVSALVFGSPKVGTIEFRQLANSLSNLKVIRLELEEDATISNNSTEKTTKWKHIGHSITIGKQDVKAYRFDKYKPLSSNNIFQFRKKDCDDMAYYNAVEKCFQKNHWIESFVGEDYGNGIRGERDEKRQMV